ncbi:MAG: Hercynine oxygenase [Anaerolineae bacterium]|nr:Hercynine oxygenase [Anaerolineae bacterium]
MAYLRYFFLVVILFGNLGASIAQQAFPEMMPEEAYTPPPKAVPYSLNTKQAVPAINQIELPPLSEEEAEGLFENENPLQETKKIKVGVDRDLYLSGPTATDSSLGLVTPLADGSVLWTLRIRSEGALGTRLHIMDCSLGAGEQLIVYDPANPEQAVGPFEGKGLNGTGDFYTPTLFSQEFVLEYHTPSLPDKPTFRIKGVNHLALDISGLFQDKILPCHNDLTCFNGSNTYYYQNGIGRMYFIDGGSGFVCSGALVVDVDVNTFIPYFLTANHCIGDQAAANTLEVYWRYNTTICNGAPPDLGTLPRSVGATLLSTRDLSVSDFCFLRLAQDPPSGTFFLGWNAADNLTGTQIHGIHHPDGSFKRISFGSITQDYNFSNLNETNYWVVSWTSGVTEGGSSGSPLIMGQGVLVGTLTGGVPDNPCANISLARDAYGRFSKTFPFIQGWINTIPPTPTTTPTSSKTPIADTVTPTPILTSTGTPTSISTHTRTSTQSVTRTPTETHTHTASPSSTPSRTMSPTNTSSPSSTATETKTGVDVVGSIVVVGRDSGIPSQVIFGVAEGAVDGVGPEDAESPPAPLPNNLVARIRNSEGGTAVTLGKDLRAPFTSGSKSFVVRVSYVGDPGGTMNWVVPEGMGYTFTLSMPTDLGGTTIDMNTVTSLTIPDGIDGDTPTFTVIMTSVGLFPLTSTNTPTIFVTPSATETPTDIIIHMPTITDTPSLTMSHTSTITPTPSEAINHTLTFTDTPITTRTLTSTSTFTSSHTTTPTASWTDTPISTPTSTRDLSSVQTTLLNFSLFWREVQYGPQDLISLLKGVHPLVTPTATDSNSATRTPTVTETVVEVVNDVTGTIVVVGRDSGIPSQVIFGVAESAADGVGLEDAESPPAPPANNLVARIRNMEGGTAVTLGKDIRAPFTSGSKSFVVRVSYVGDPGGTMNWVVPEGKGYTFTLTVPAELGGDTIDMGSVTTLPIPDGIDGDTLAFTLVMTATGKSHGGDQVQRTDIKGTSQGNASGIVTSTPKVVDALSLTAGWNLVSFPRLPSSPSFSAVFGANLGTVWSYDARTQQWSNPSTIELKRAYWIRLLNGQSVPLSGSLPEDASLSLLLGWNFSGPVADLSGPAQHSDIGSIWGYDGQWTSKPDPLRAGKGYWIKASKDLVLGGTGPTLTPTFTRTSTKMETPTATSSRTLSPTKSSTSTLTRSLTPTPTPSRSYTSTRTSTPTLTNSVTRTGTRTFTSTRTPTPTSTIPATRTNTHTPTASRTGTTTSTRTPSRTFTPTSTHSSTRTPSFTPTPVSIEGRWSGQGLGTEGWILFSLVLQAGNVSGTLKEGSEEEEQVSGTYSLNGTSLTFNLDEIGQPTTWAFSGITQSFTVISGRFTGGPYGNEDFAITLTKVGPAPTFTVTPTVSPTPTEPLQIGIWRNGIIGAIVTGSTVSSAPGDDGYYRKGKTRSYTDHGDGTVTDNNTGLMWVKDPTVADVGSTYTLDNAKKACEDLIYAGYSDWILPTIQQISTLRHAGRYPPAVDPLFKCVYISYYNYAEYWSSTVVQNGLDKDYYTFNSTSGFVERSDISDLRYVRPVRYSIVEKQVRFTDNRDGTISDNNSGLMWIKNPGIAGVGGQFSWHNALKVCEDLSFAGHSDWRLPNINEISSLVDYSEYEPSIDPMFISENWYYWSSTLPMDNSYRSYPWYVDMHGEVEFHSFTLSSELYVRPVRNIPNQVPGDSLVIRSSLGPSGGVIEAPSNSFAAGLRIEIPSGLLEEEVVVVVSVDDQAMAGQTLVIRISLEDTNGKRISKRSKISGTISVKVPIKTDIASAWSADFSSEMGFAVRSSGSTNWSESPDPVTYSRERRDLTGSLFGPLSEGMDFSVFYSKLFLRCFFQKTGFLEVNTTNGGKGSVEEALKGGAGKKTLILVHGILANAASTWAESSTDFPTELSAYYDNIIFAQYPSLAGPLPWDLLFIPSIVTNSSSAFCAYNLWKDLLGKLEEYNLDGSGFAQSEVHLVGHSQGGVVSRWFFDRLPSYVEGIPTSLTDSQNPMIDKFISLDSPQCGIGSSSICSSWIALLVPSLSGLCGLLNLGGEEVLGTSILNQSIMIDKNRVYLVSAEDDSIIPNNSALCGTLGLLADHMHSEKGDSHSSIHTALGSPENADYLAKIKQWLGLSSQSPTLTSVAITDGPDSVNENSSANYRATAYFSDGTNQTTEDVTSFATWSVNPTTYAEMDSSEKGRLNTKSVTSNQAVTVSASYTTGGVTKTGQKTVTIVDVPVSGDIITIDIQNFAQNFPGARQMKLVRIPAGTFQMGSPDTERGRYSDWEGPVHTVTITNDFYMGETEVTQAQWQAIMGSNPASGYGVGLDYPVYNISWNDITQTNGFLERMDAQSSYNGFRLPTEAEWEYACRAETSTRFSFGDNLSCDDSCGACALASQYMVWCGNDQDRSEPVGPPRLHNAFGLFDMHGNVWEWCQDGFLSDFYNQPEATLPNPLCTNETGYRVVRGGDWKIDAKYCRSSMRTRWYSSTGPRLYVGLRVVLPASQ